jgi:hypothetical protein
MISVLLPSRGRPEGVVRLWDSLVAKTSGEWEMIVRLDDDDASPYPPLTDVRYLRGPRGVLSDLWNDAWRQAQGNIFALCADDVIYRTQGWDRIVGDAFPADGIAYVHGDDLGGKGQTLGTLGFLHRNWTDAVGTFTPPYFVCDYADLWLNEIADNLGRRVFVPIVTEHMHPAFGKAPVDQTHRERIARSGGIDAVWATTAEDRLRQTETLRAVMR